MTLRAVFFDFGGTLGYLDPIIDEPWKAWSEVARHLGLAIPDSQIQRVNEEADRRFNGQIYDYHGRTHEFWRMRDTWVIERLGVTARRKEFFETLQAIFGDPSRVQLYPETRAALEETRTFGCRMGVISNFTDSLPTLLHHHGLDAFFDSVTYSQAVGARKPDPRVFLHALELAGCEPEEAVHVGDSWEGDYLGAGRAGMTALWLNREKRPAPSPCQEISDLRGLRPFLSLDDGDRA